MIFRLLRRLASLAPPRVGNWTTSIRIARPRSLSNPQLIRFGRDVVARTGLIISPITRHGQTQYTPRVEIGDGCYLGRYCFLSCIDHILIGRNVVLSDYVYITDVTHGMTPGAGHILEQPLLSKGPVVIGDDCFLGYGVRVMPGVTLGRNCIVATSAVVTRSFPNFTMVAGIPAQPVKRFDPTTATWLPFEADAGLFS